MGNEMGNNNTSGFHEEENTKAEAGRNSLQEPVNENGVKGGNLLPAPQKDDIEKETELDSNDLDGTGDDYTRNRTSDGKEQEETKDHPPLESPIEETKSDEASGILTTSLSKELEDHEKPAESNFEDNHSGVSHNQIEHQASFIEEEDRMPNPTSITASKLQDQEPHDSTKSNFDNEFMKIHDDQSVEHGGNSLTWTDDILESNAACAKEENDQHLDEKKEEDDLVVKEKASQEGRIPTEEKLDVGNELQNGSNKTASLSPGILSDDGGKHDGELTVQSNCENSSLESQQEDSISANFSDSPKEVSSAEDKCIILTGDDNMVRKESESEEDKLDLKSDQSNKGLISESDSEEANTSKSDSLLEPNCENNEKEELVIASSDPAADGDCKKEANVADSYYCIEPSEENLKEPTGENVLVPAIGMPPADLFISNGKRDVEEVRDREVKEEEPSVKQIIKETMEIEAEAEAEAEPEPDSVLQSQDLQQEAVTGSKDDQSDVNSFLGLQSKGCSELFVTKASTFHSTSLTAESLTSTVELAMPEAAHIVPAAQETVTETKTSASSAIKMDMEETQSGEQSNSILISAQAEESLQGLSAFLYQSQGPQQETVMGSEYDQCNSKSILEPETEGSNELFVKTDSTFHAKSLIAESLALAIDLEIEKPLQEALEYVSAAPETVTEPKASSTVQQSSEECANVETTSVLERDGFEALDSVERFSTESNPNSFNIHAYMRKSPSFNLDLRAETRKEESDKMPLLFQDKTTIEILSSQADVTLQCPLLQAQSDDQESLTQHPAVPVEEKVITLERSDSEKSRTPFLGFKKQDEEEAHHAMVTPKKQKQGAAKKTIKEAQSYASPTVKEKHKRRPSLFTNCMCCTTVLN